MKEEKRLRNADEASESNRGSSYARMVKAPMEAKALPRVGLGLMDAPQETLPISGDLDFGGGMQDRSPPSKAMMSLAVAAASVAASEAATAAAAAAAVAAVAVAPPAPAPPKALGLKKLLHQRVQCDEASANPMSAFSPKKLLKHRVLAAQAQTQQASTIVPVVAPKVEVAEDRGRGYRNDGQDARASRGWYPAEGTSVGRRFPREDGGFDGRANGTRSGADVGERPGAGGNMRGDEGRDRGYGKSGECSVDGGSTTADVATNGRHVGEDRGYNGRHGMDAVDGRNFNGHLGREAGDEPGFRGSGDKGLDAGCHGGGVSRESHGARGMQRGSEERGGTFAQEVDVSEHAREGGGSAMGWRGGGEEGRDAARDQGYQSSYRQQHRSRGQTVREFRGVCRMTKESQIKGWTEKKLSMHAFFFGLRECWEGSSVNVKSSKTFW